MAGDPPPNNLPEVPWHRKLNLRQNQRQRMSNSGRPFISPDFILTRLPSKDGMIPVLVLCILQVSKDSHYSQHSGTARKDHRNLRDELEKRRDLEERRGWSYPRMRTRRDPNLFMQETPVLALRVQSCAARDSRSTRLQHRKDSGQCISWRLR
jgi:hypothetical protein